MTIESGSRFVEKQEQGWLASKLDANTESLALLDVEPFARQSDDGIGKIAYVKKMYNLLHVGKLLALRYVEGLP
jgi:hypothetical protein